MPKDQVQRSETRLCTLKYPGYEELARKFVYSHMYHTHISCIFDTIYGSIVNVSRALVWHNDLVDYAELNFFFRKAFLF